MARLICTLVGCCFALLWAVALVQCAAAVPLYSIVPLGFDDLEHTRNDGFRSSKASILTDSAWAAGISPRYNGGSTSLGQSAWLYDGESTTHIGLTGPEHTSDAGYKYTSVYHVSESGLAGGSSAHYSGSTLLGGSTWLYDGATTIAIGLTGPEHTRNDDYKSSSVYQLNEAGQVIGTSYRYVGGTASLGFSAWLHDGGTTTDIGLTSSEYTRNDGYKSSSAIRLNATGQVAGTSVRYNGGSTSFGQTAWLHQNGTTIDIGLTGAEYTRNDGYRGSTVSQMNEAGQVSGYSSRYNGGSASLGQTAWLRGDASTFDIGLTTAEHTRNNGYRYSMPFQLNEAGMVTGHSDRYNGGSIDLGRSAWLYNGATTIAVGLVDIEHTRDNGAKSSSLAELNAAGQVSGYSTRYNGGSTVLGQSAWLFDGDTTISIGLVGAEHSRTDGYKYSGYSDDRFSHMNGAGQVRGTSRRYNGGSADLGPSAWLYDGETTIDIGLAGSAHTRNDGYKFALTQELNEGGQVRGYSYRYNGGNTQLGQDAWVYDRVLDQTFSLNLSTRSDGYAYSRADYLGDDGLVLGVYTRFDALDNSLGERAFYFTVEDGAHDLGSLVAGGLTANGWDYLVGDLDSKSAPSIRANDLGHILGFGKLTSQSGGLFAFLLNPVGGDFNGDGSIDAADYVLWRKNGGASDDYDTWRANFGSLGGTGAGASTIADAVVPEPTTAPLAVLAILLSTLVARHRRISAAET